MRHDVIVPLDELQRQARYKAEYDSRSESLCRLVQSRDRMSDADPVASTLDRVIANETKALGDFYERYVLKL